MVDKDFWGPEPLAIPPGIETRRLTTAQSITLERNQIVYQERIAAPVSGFAASPFLELGSYRQLIVFATFFSAGVMAGTFRVILPSPTQTPTVPPTEWDLTNLPVSVPAGTVKSVMMSFGPTPVLGDNFTFDGLSNTENVGHWPMVPARFQLFSNVGSNAGIYNFLVFGEPR